MSMALQYLTFITSISGLGLVVRLSFNAGKLIQRIEDLEKQVTRIDQNGCAQGHGEA